MIGAKRRLITVLTACFVALLSLVMAILTLTVQPKTASAEETAQYTFSSYTAGTQYAENEVHKLDDIITITTTDCHFTTQLRIYSSASNNGYAIISSTKGISAVAFNMGYKKDTLNVYGLTNEADEGVLIGGIATTTTDYKDYSLDFGGKNYKYLKLDVEGSNQIRIATMTLTFVEDGGSGEGGDTPCDHVYGDGVETTAATCTTAGEMTYTCTVEGCGDSYTEEIAALGHNYVDGVCTNCLEEQPEQSGWMLVKSVEELKAGDNVVIVAKDSAVAMSTTQNSNNRGQASVTKDGESVTFGDDVQVLTLQAGTTADTWAFNTDSGYLYAASSSNNYLRTETKLSANSSWVITIASEIATIKAQGTYTRNWMRYNSSSKIFSCYASGQADICLYKEFSGEITCTHPEEKLTKEETKAPTCTEEGKQTVTCACGYSTEENIAALGHDYSSEVTKESTCVEVGERTYTCQRENCGDSYTKEIAALGHSFGEWAVKTEPTCTTDGKNTRICATCEAEETQVVPKKHNLEESKTLEEGGTVYVCSACEYVETQVSTNVWELVTNVNDLQIGTQIVIVASGYDYALSTNQKTSNRGQASVTKDGNTVTFGNDVQVLTLEEGTVNGTWAFNTGSGYLYAASSSSNHLKTQEDCSDNSSWAISIAENGVATVKAQGAYTRNWMRYNNTDTLFSCYAENSTQKDISIYCNSTVSTTKISGATITLGEDVTVNYKVSLDEKFAAAKMRFLQDGEVVATVDGETDGDKYTFGLKLPPQCMTDVFTAELVYNDTVIANKGEYSIQQYAQNQLNSDKCTEELKQLITDMLYYGAAAQEYKGYNEGNLACDNVDGLGTPSESVPEATQYTLTNELAEGESYPAYFMAVGVWFDDVNKIYVKINTTENVVLKINTVEVSVTDTTVYTEGILATSFAEKYTFELYVGEQLMQTLTYSVNSYAYSKKNAETPMGRLALALYRYGASAEAYAK